MKKLISLIVTTMLMFALTAPTMAASSEMGLIQNNMGDAVEEIETEVDTGESESIPGDSEEETAPDEGEDIPSESEGEQGSGEVVKFPFTIYLKDADGNPLAGTYSYESKMKNSEEVMTGTISDGDVIYLTDKSYIDIFGLPEGTRYEVVEGETEGYSLDSSSNTVGMITTDTISHAEFVNRENTGEHFIDRLPETGGEGIWGIVCVGASFITLGGCLYLTKKEI